MSPGCQTEVEPIITAGFVVPEPSIIASLIPPGLGLLTADGEELSIAFSGTLLKDI